MDYLVLLTLIFLVIFILTNYFNNTSLLNGLFFDLFILSVLLNYIIYVYTVQNYLLNITMIILLIISVIILIFGVYILIIVLLVNARSVYKKESRTLSNSLTLILGLALIVYLIFSFFITSIQVPRIVLAFWSAITMIVTFYFFHITVFLSSVFTANLPFVKKDKDYIIVLGAGLIDGKVTPLLAKRIDKAISFYQKQKKKRKPPILIFSGGQGEDEIRSEAIAMQEYALTKGIPVEDTLLEDKSTNTFENMEFSKIIIEENHSEKQYKCLYASNNYHLFRAGIYAKKAGLKARGIGCKTAIYYLPNALIREYFAFFWLHKKGYFITLGIIFIISFIFTLIAP